jgi:Zn-dependent metalloprotease
MSTIHNSLCGVIPPHILTNLAERAPGSSGGDVRVTIAEMEAMASGRRGAHALLDFPAPQGLPGKNRNVYDAQQQYVLPGKLVTTERLDPGSGDLQVKEAFHGCGATYDFFADVFGRRSIDGRGMALDSTVHYGLRFENALWDGRQMIFGDGDGRIFNRFTGSLEVIAHELTHGITQHAAALGYSGETGALNEHLSDAFGIMAKQYTLGHHARNSDWLIGAGLFARSIHGKAVRSMAAPGTAYDDPLLGRDPQPWHMRDYVETSEDNGGVHINSGILNHGFYLAAKTLGGQPWRVLGKIWYAALTERLQADCGFQDFARTTVDIAGELFGFLGREQRAVAAGWKAVGLDVAVFRRPAARVPSPGGDVLPFPFIDGTKQRQSLAA